MRLFRRFLSTILLVFSCLCAQAQMAPSDPVAVKASLVNFQAQRVEWEKTLRSVKLEELPISYSDGKMIQKWLDADLQILKLTSTLTDEILLTGRLAEITAATFGLLDLQHGLGNAATQLDELKLGSDPTSNKPRAWSSALSGIANGPLDKLYLSLHTFVLSRTDELERGCSK